jgi:hypothetical protein
MQQRELQKPAAKQPKEQRMLRAMLLALLQREAGTQRVLQEMPRVTQDAPPARQLVKEPALPPTRLAVQPKRLEVRRERLLIGLAAPQGRLPMRMEQALPRVKAPARKKLQVGAAPNPAPVRAVAIPAVQAQPRRTQSKTPELTST